MQGEGTATQYRDTYRYSTGTLPPTDTYHTKGRHFLEPRMKNHVPPSSLLVGARFHPRNMRPVVRGASAMPSLNCTDSIHAPCPPSGSTNCTNPCGRKGYQRRVAQWDVGARVLPGVAEDGGLHCGGGGGEQLDGATHDGVDLEHIHYDLEFGIGVGVGVTKQLWLNNS